MPGSDWIEDVKLLTTRQQAHAAVAYLPLNVQVIEECAKSDDAQVRSLAVVIAGRTLDIERAKSMTLHDPSERVQGLALMQLAQLADDNVLNSVALAISRLRRRQLLVRLRTLRRHKTIDGILVALRSAGDLASYQQHLYFASDELLRTMSLEELLWTSEKVVRKLIDHRPLAMSRLLRKYMKEDASLVRYGDDVLKSVCRSGRLGREEGFELLKVLFDLKHTLPGNAFWDLRKDMARLVAFVTSDHVQEHCHEKSALRSSIRSCFGKKWLYTYLTDVTLRQLMDCEKAPLTWRDVLTSCPNSLTAWKQEAAEHEFEPLLAKLQSGANAKEYHIYAWLIASFPKAMRERLADASLQKDRFHCRYEFLKSTSWDAGFHRLAEEAMSDNKDFWNCHRGGCATGLTSLMCLTKYNRERLAEALNLLQKICFRAEDGSDWDRVLGGLKALERHPLQRLRSAQVCPTLRELIKAALFCLQTKKDDDSWIEQQSWTELTTFVLRFLPHDSEWAFHTLQNIAITKMSKYKKEMMDPSDRRWSAWALAWPFEDDLPKHLTRRDFTPSFSRSFLDFLLWRLGKIEELLRLPQLSPTSKNSHNNEGLDKNLNLGYGALKHTGMDLTEYMRELLKRTVLHPVLSEKIAAIGYKHCRQLFYERLSSVLTRSPSFIYSLTARCALAQTDRVRLLRYLRTLDDFEWGSSGHRSGDHPVTLDRRMNFENWPSTHQSELAELCVKQLKRILNEVPRPAIKLLKHMSAADPSHLIALADDVEAVDNTREVALRLLGRLDGPQPLARLTRDLKDASLARSAIYALVPKLKYLPIASVATILDSTNCSHLQVAKQVIRLRAALYIPGWETLLLDKLRSKRAHDDLQRAVIRCLRPFLNMSQVWDALEEVHRMLNWRVMLEIIRLDLDGLSDTVAQRHLSMLVDCFEHEEPLLRSALYEEIKKSSRAWPEAQRRQLWTGVTSALSKATDEAETSALGALFHKFTSLWNQGDVDTLLREYLELYAREPTPSVLRRLKLITAKMNIGQDSDDLLEQIYKVPDLRLSMWKRLIKHDDWPSKIEFCDKTFSKGFAEFYIMDAFKRADGGSNIDREMASKFKHELEFALFAKCRSEEHLEGPFRGQLEIDILRDRSWRDGEPPLLPESVIPWPFPPPPADQSASEAGSRAGGSEEMGNDEYLPEVEDPQSDFESENDDPPSENDDAMYD